MGGFAGLRIIRGLSSNVGVCANSDPVEKNTLGTTWVGDKVLARLTRWTTTASRALSSEALMVRNSASSTSEKRAEARGYL